ncbi:Hypothetical protein AT6N2_L2381 [Agrobacterium tumefaciens]|nr:Hypothetical protein AT6N2_L2381 [Agrobacterium tumefaciens]
MSCGPPGVCDTPGHDTFWADDLAGNTCGVCRNRCFDAKNLDRSPLYEAMATWDPNGKAQRTVGALSLKPWAEPCRLSISLRAN